MKACNFAHDLQFNYIWIRWEWFSVDLSRIGTGIHKAGFDKRTARNHISKKTFVVVTRPATLGTVVSVDVSFLPLIGSLQKLLGSRRTFTALVSPWQWKSRKDRARLRRSVQREVGKIDCQWSLIVNISRFERHRHGSGVSSIFFLLGSCSVMAASTPVSHY